MYVKWYFNLFPIIFEWKYETIMKNSFPTNLNINSLLAKLSYKKNILHRSTLFFSCIETRGFFLYRNTWFHENVTLSTFFIVKHHVNKSLIQSSVNLLVNVITSSNIFFLLYPPTCVPVAHLWITVGK